MPRKDPVTVARYALVAACALYLLRYLGRDRTWTLLDDGILAIHEAGHLLFSPFGEFLTVLGGSLFQLLVPAAFVLYFLKQRDRYAAAIVTFWLAASCFNLATYVADARAGELPLITGNRADHDWTWLLIQMDLLSQDVLLGRIVKAVGVSCYAAGIIGGLHYAERRTKTAAEAGHAEANSTDARTAAGTASRATGTKP